MPGPSEQTSALMGEVRAIALALVKVRDLASQGGLPPVLDALTLIAPPPFGEHMSPANALNVIYKGRGKQFHPALVEQFIQCVGVYPAGSLVELYSGDIAVVIAQNMVRRMQPRIMVVRDAKCTPIIPHRMLDLLVV